MSLKLVASNDRLVVAIRDAVLPVLRASGILRIQGDGLRRIALMTGPWSFAHWTPFRDIAPDDDVSPGYRHAIDDLRPGATMDYGLDVRHLGKPVLSLLWSDEGTIQVTAFQRGAWEQDALALAPPATTGGQGPKQAGTD
jgi:hypothetical protein